LSAIVSSGRVPGWRAIVWMLRQVTGPTPSKQGVIPPCRDFDVGAVRLPFAPPACWRDDVTVESQREPVGEITQVAAVMEIAELVAEQDEPPTGSNHSTI
jgi:hypothetical protein